MWKLSIINKWWENETWAIKDTSLESWIVWNDHYLQVGWGQGDFKIKVGLDKGSK